MKAALAVALGLAAALPLAAMPAAAAPDAAPEVAASPKLPEPWRNWRYFRALELGDRSGPGRPRLERLRVPVEVHARALAHLADLRVLDAVGREVPFVLQARTGKQAFDWRNAKLQEVSFDPGHDTQLVVDTGAKRQLHNAVRLTAESDDFIVWVEVSIAERPGQWRILRQRAPIYRFRGEQVEGSQVISYPESHSRYLRVRILDPQAPFPVVACEVGLEVREEPVRLPVEAPLAPVQASPATGAAARGASVFETDLGDLRAPLSEARFETTQPEFHRVVRVSSADDGRNWNRVGTGEIYRSVPGGSGSESLGVSFPEATARRWRVEVLNRDDAPLTGLQARLYAAARDVVFQGDGPGPWRLIYGNSRARAAAYDLEKRLSPDALERTAEVRPGPEQENSAFVDPRPFTERHPFVLWLAIGIAVATLAGLALRTLRTS
jgi:hypothetical protein